MVAVGKGKSQRWRFPKLAIGLAAVSQVVVFHHLYNQWPRLLHPLEPPLLSTPNRQQPDVSYLGAPIVYRSPPKFPSSSIHCIGETFEPNAWMVRSCRYHNLCFDFKEREYIYLQSEREAALKKALDEAAAAGTNPDFKTVSTVFSPEHSAVLGKPCVGGSCPGKDQKFLPKAKTQEELSESGFYELPAKVVLVPFATSGQENWDPVWLGFFPIFTVLSTFGLTGPATRPLLVPDSYHEKYREILPLMGSYSDGPQQFRDHPDGEYLVPKGSNKPRSNLVCAKQTVAGIGRIADRGLQGQEQSGEAGDAVPPNLNTHNMAQGKTLRDFRDYILRNLLGREGSSEQNDNSVITVSFYGHATQQSTLGLQEKLTALDPKKRVRIQRMQLLDGTSHWTGEKLKQVAQLASQTSVLMVKCCDWDAALAATLLPTGSTLIVYHDADQQPQQKNSNAWDLLSNAGYVQTHWVPKGRDDDDQAVLSVLRNVISSETSTQ